ncbi:hypothetical protein FRC03_007315 [Tulasnella sp. 419]|nr:hypothetical protein FRC03_007315 [Tulasnella sp. 419]
MDTTFLPPSLLPLTQPIASDVSTRSRATFQYMRALNEPTAMSPDAMLAAYATRKKPSKKGSLSGATRTSSANGGMRVMRLSHHHQLMRKILMEEWMGRVRRRDRG